MEKERNIENKKIIFMGTPAFAVTILDKLYQNNFHIAAVITAPDKPAGRGQQIQQSDVKKYAVEKELNILQPINLKADEFISQLKEINADLFVVVAFRMLPEIVWSMPKYGTINLHASLLPNYRGAAPINWAIINGEKETGVTSFFIEKEIDTGKIIEQEKVDITENMTAGELHDQLMHLGAKTIISTVQKIFNHSADALEQSSFNLNNIKHAPKIFKEDCFIDWNQSANSIHNKIRGLSPYPAAWTFLTNQNGEKKSFKLFDSIISDIAVSNKNYISSNKEGILFPCSDFFLSIKEIQMEGKRKMSFKEFLAGNSLEDWKIND